MTNKELSRKKELCSTLDMSFDEANELFSSETLNNMTMAQISGGSSGSLNIATFCIYEVHPDYNNTIIYHVSYKGMGPIMAHTSFVDNGDGTVSFEMGYEDTTCDCGNSSYRSQTYTTLKSELSVGQSFTLDHCTSAI